MFGNHSLCLCHCHFQRVVLLSVVTKRCAPLSPRPYNSSFLASCLRRPIRCFIQERASAFMDAPWPPSIIPLSRSSCFCTSSVGLDAIFSMNPFCLSLQPTSGFFALQSEVPPCSSTYCCMYSSLGPNSSHIAMSVFFGYAL